MSPETRQFLIAASAQVGSISAFLGGFSATILASALFAAPKRKLAGTVIGLQVLAALAFIVSALAATMLGASLSPGASPDLATTSFQRFAGDVMNAGFMAGICTLIAGIGASGWLRSRAMGLVSSLMAGAGLVIMLLLLVRFGG